MVLTVLKQTIPVISAVAQDIMAAPIVAKDKPSSTVKAHKATCDTPESRSSPVAAIKANVKSNQRILKEERIVASHIPANTNSDMIKGFYY